VIALPAGGVKPPAGITCWSLTAPGVRKQANPGGPGDLGLADRGPPVGKQCALPVRVT
jgi:hypothetical protein